VNFPPRPPVVTREDWGADESLGLDADRGERWPHADWPLQILVVHHTAWPEPLGEPAEAVRRIHHLNASERGWGDIGYGYLIGPDGTIYEGRSPRRSPPGQAPAGAHVRDHNAGSLGIALLGNFVTSEPAPAALEALVAVLAFEASRAGLDPTGTTVYVNPVNGRGAFVPTIAAHRDLAPTACPGDVLHRRLPGLRQATSAACRSPSAPS
jgi:hypothetical protein